MAMRKSLPALFKAHPLAFAAILLGAYLVWFTLPSILRGSAPGEGAGIEGMGDMVRQMLPEIAFAASIICAVALLRGWREMRISTPLTRGWIWAVIPVALYIGLFILAGVVALGEAGFSVTNLPMQIFGPLIITTFLVGVFEEFLFRGVVFRAVEIARGPIIAVLVSSLLFGLMHYVNWVSGQSLSSTHWQVLHAGMAGLLYVGIMLKTGSIWPAVFAHGAWDSTVSFVATARSFASPAELTTSDYFTQAAIYGFEPVFGLFLVYLWWRSQHRDKVS